MNYLAIAGLSIALLFTAVLLSFPAQAALFRHLREQWPDLYKATGEPKMVRLNGEHFASPRLYRFLILREHRNLGDKRLSKLSDINLAFVAVIALLIATLALTITLGKQV